MNEKIITKILNFNNKEKAISGIPEIALTNKYMNLLKIKKLERN